MKNLGNELLKGVVVMLKVLIFNLPNILFLAGLVVLNIASFKVLGVYGLFVLAITLVILAFLLGAVMSESNKTKKY